MLQPKLKYVIFIYEWSVIAKKVFAQIYKILNFFETIEISTGITFGKFGPPYNRANLP